VDDAKAATKRLGLFLISRATGYQRLLAKDGQLAAQRLGLDLEVFSADDTAARQSVDILKFLHAHADQAAGVIVMPVSDVGHEQAVDSLARKVLARGAAWVVLNRDLEGHILRLRQEHAGGLAALVTIDHREIGRLQARQVKALLPAAGGAVLYVVGSSFTSAARDRRAGFLEELATAPATVHQLEGLWSVDSARDVVSRWLASRVGRDEPLRAVACQNDPMALGARLELTRLAADAGRPEWAGVPVLGVDGVPDEGRRLVDEGTLTATVVAPSTSGRAVELLAKAWRTGEPVPAKTLLPATPYPPGSLPPG
jgi:ABC-type sugar transport system substrate-binding protein